MINGSSLLKLHGAKKELSLLTLPGTLCGLICVFLTEELRHPRLSYGIVDDLMSGLPRALCDLAHLSGHSIQTLLVETIVLLSVSGERQ